MRYMFADCDLDMELRLLRRADSLRTLRPKPLQVLLYLIEHCDRVVSKQELAEQVWPEQYISDAVIQNSVLAVRQAVGDSGREQRIIQTVHGYGYRFIAAVTTSVTETEHDTRHAAQHEATAPPLASPLPPPLAAETTSREVPNASPSSAPPAVSSRRQLTVLFCDLVDSTHLSSQLDPEDYMDIIHGYHKMCAAVIEHFAGHIVQYLGDGILVYFGYPVAHEDDAQRAGYTALGILEKLHLFNDHLQATHGVHIAMRMGIHTGLAVVSPMGTGDHSEQLALGETPNIAARLQTLAAPNTVVISAATYRLVQGYFACQALAAQTLRGLTTPLDTYRLLRASDARSRFAVSLRHGLMPLVGRERELALLRERWSQVQEDGTGHVILISGEAGIGKSRLVQALKDEILSEAHTRLDCQGSPYHQHTAFWPLIDVLPRVLQWEPDEPMETKVSKMEQALQQRRLPFRDSVPLLSSLLSLPLNAQVYPPLALSPEEQRHQTFEALLRFVLQSTTLQPVLLVVEDLHWMDPSTCAFLELLVDQGPTAPLLIVITCRPEMQPSWMMRSHVTSLSLDRLGAAQVQEMIAWVAGEHDLSTAVQQQIVTTTDGVPLFVEEVTKMMREVTGRQAEDKGQAGHAIASVVTIPATLQDLLMARLDQMGGSKELAQIGSVIGRSFDYRLLHEIADWDEVALTIGLRELVAAELVYQRGLPPHASYMFTHAMMQEAAYNSLLRRRRKELHQAVGAAIETRYADRVSEHEAELAHHFTQAEMWVKALHYSAIAGDRASDAFANAEAKAHYTRALHAVEQCDIAISEPDAVGHLYAKYAAVLELLGEHENAVTAYQHALAIMRQMGDARREVDILLGLSGVYNSMHDAEPAASYSEQALTRARVLDDQACLATCLVRRASIRSVAFGQLIEATDQAEEARRLAQDVGEPRALAHTLNFLGAVLQWRARFDESLACLQEGLALAQGIHDGRMIGHAAFFCGNSHAARGEYEAALAWYQRLDDYASSSGDTFWFPRIPNCIGGVHLELFDSQEALRLNLQGDEAAKQWYPWPEPRGHSLVQAGLAYLDLDQPGQAEACFREAEALLNDDAWMRWRWQMVLLRAFGELALAEHRHDDAWTHARQSLELAMQSDSRKHVARSQLLQGQILLARGQWDDAVQVLATAVNLADHIQTPRVAWMGRAELATALLQSGRDQEAETHYTKAIRIIESLAAKLQQPRMRQHLLQAPPVLAIYNALGYRPPAA